MSNFTSRNQQAEYQKNQQSFADSLIKEYLNNNQNNNQNKSTKKIDRLVGQITISTNIISLYRTDHYSGGGNTPESGTFQYSRYTAIIGGIRISADDYKNLIRNLQILQS